MSTRARLMDRARTKLRPATYAPVITDLGGLALAALITGAVIVAMLVVRQFVLLLVLVPAGAGVGRWGSTWFGADRGWSAKVSRARHRALVTLAIDAAPHRFARKRELRHPLYGTFIEERGQHVAVILVQRPPRLAHRGRAECTVVIAERHFSGEQVEAAATTLSAFEDRARELEVRGRDRLAEQAAAADRRRGEDEHAAEDEQLLKIDERYEAEFAKRDADLAMEQRRQVAAEAEQSASALARALRRR